VHAAVRQPVPAFTAEQQARTTERDLNVARFALTKLLGLPPASILRRELLDDGKPDRSLLSGIALPQGGQVATRTPREGARTTERDLNVARFALTKLLGLPPASILRLAITAVPAESRLALTVRSNVGNCWMMASRTAAS
jgi:outer membrane protein TolC